RVEIQRWLGGDMPAGEFSLGEAIDEDEALHAPEVSVCAGYQLEHQRRAVAHGARNVSQNEKVGVARAPRAKAQFGQRTAVLQGGADSAAEIDLAAWRSVKPAAQAQAEAARERRQGVARGLVLEIGICRERRAPRTAERSLPA